MKTYWQNIYRSLLEGREFAVATVISHQGSTPRTSGSKMIIYGKRQISGTIGGGYIEGDVISFALECIQARSSGIKAYDLGGDLKEGMDLICGGKMRVLVEFVENNDENLTLYHLLHECAENGREGISAARIVQSLQTKGIDVKRSARVEGGGWQGALPVSISLEKELISLESSCYSSCLIDFEGETYLVDKITTGGTLYLVGAGHVAKEVAAMAGQASFRCVVIDDRDEFANKERFPHARVSLCSDMHQPLAGIAVENNSYIVIATRGHVFDKEALRMALRTEARYIGMIGSSRKRESIYRALELEGFSPKELLRVHCPIGLSIGAETPFEIGVSVMAELIQHRSSR